LLWTLVLLNAVLAGSFVFQFFPDNTAQAQVAGRRPGDYILIPGIVSGGNSAVVYVLDVTTGSLSAMSYDQPRNEIDLMPQIDLGRVFADGAANTARKPRR
jgi:hypothetical protein